MSKSTLSDWNDLHVSAGIDAVKQQLQTVLDENTVVEPSKSPQNASAAQHREGYKQDWKENLQRTKTNVVMPTISNIKMVLENDENFKDAIGYCNFSYKIIKRKKMPFRKNELGEWSDSDNHRMQIYLSSRYGFTPKVHDVMGAVLVHAEEHDFHPVREYLEQLEWDGTKRVATWLHQYLGVEDTDYSRLVSIFFLVSAVARVVRPPVKVDTVLILEGLQGLGKSTMIENLFGEWFTDTPMILGEKDAFQQMQGVWVIELAELDSFNKAENTRAKQFFGSKTDRYRPSYGRVPKPFHRQCVFIGTTNQDTYLKDPTGNRRYWPVVCKKLDSERLRNQRDQLWAEAYQLFSDGMQWWVPDEHIHLFESQQEDRFESDVWEPIIIEWLRRHRQLDYTLADIMGGALEMDPQAMRPPEQKRVGQIMHRLGFVKKKKRVNGKRPAFYYPPEDFWDVK